MIDIQSKNGNSKFFLLTLLGMLTAFGPFVTDMYLPSLPSMREYFKTTPSLVQLGLTASMIGLAAGEIFFGSLSDKYGHRSPMLAAMYLFIISTFLISFNKWLKPLTSCFILKGFLKTSPLGASIATNEKSAETSIPTVGLLKNLDIVYISFKFNLEIE